MQIMEKKNQICLLFVAFLLLKGTCMCAEVYNGTCGENVQWEYNDSTGVLRITGEGSMTNTSFSTYASSIKRVEIGEGVKSIKAYAFAWNYSKLDTVICADVDTVYEHAFNQCTALKYCDFGKSVKVIQRGALFSCPILTTLKWSDCLESIEGEILASYDNNSTAPKSIKLNDTIFFPATFKSNQEVMFGKAPSVPAVIWNAKHPQDPTTTWNTPLNIGTGYGWSFKKIIFGDSVEYIPNYLCNEYLGDSVVLQEGLKEIGKYAFLNCKKMTYLSLPSTLTKIGVSAFEGCKLLPHVDLPENLNEIGANLFYNCSVLADVQIPENVTSIGENAFSNIVGQDSLYIPDKVVAIGGNAFENWSLLEHVSIGKNVVLIGDNAFKGDSAIKKITVWAAVPPMVSEGTLADIPDSAWLSVLPDSRKLYREHAYWGRFRMADVPDSAMIQRTVTVDAAETTADFTWPTDSAAHSYQIDIYKDGAVFCKLTLGNHGQLLGISFSAPGRRAPMNNADDSQPYTLSFKVTGLNAASRYNYVLSTLDENGTPLHVYIGDFATLGYQGELQGDGLEVIPTPPIIPANPEAQTPTAIEEIYPSSLQGRSGEATKVLRDGQLYLLHNGTTYNVQGVELK